MNKTVLVGFSLALEWEAEHVITIRGEEGEGKSAGTGVDNARAKGAASAGVATVEVAGAAAISWVGYVVGGRDTKALGGMGGGCRRSKGLCR